jgi:ABC-2 type transport system permease protein
MANVWTIYRREIGSYFASPIAYIFICAFLVVMGIYFFLFTGFFQRPNPDLRAYFIAFPLAFSLLIPPMTMRLWSEEKKSGTIEILMTLPIKCWEAVLGKFLAGYTVIALTLLLTLTVPLSISLVLQLDWGVVFTSYLGAFLLAGVCIAIGAWMSALTQDQIVALLAAMTFLFVLWGIGIPEVTQYVNNIADRLGETFGLVGRWFGAALSGVVNTLSWFGTFFHYQNFVKGLLKLVDVGYAIVMMAFFLILNNFAVEWRKFR